MPRQEYKQQTKIDRVREVLSKLPPEQRADVSNCVAAIKAAKIQGSSDNIQMLAYKVRKELNETPANGKTSNAELFKYIDVVAKASKQVGGLDTLKQIVALIERVKGIFDGRAA